MELTRIKDRMKSILLHDEEWDFFIDALQLTAQQDIEYQNSEGTVEHLILVNVDAGVASTTYEIVLEGGTAGTVFVDLEDGYYSIVTPGVYGDDGTRVVRVVNGIPQFRTPLPEGIEQIAIKSVSAASAEGFKLDYIKSLLFSNNATSFLDLMAILNMYGFSQRRLQISPGDVAEYSYNVFFYKVIVGGKALYNCPMKLLPESVIEEASASSPAKVNGDYIISAAGQEIIGHQDYRIQGQLEPGTVHYRVQGQMEAGNQRYRLFGRQVNIAEPIPIRGYRNGVVDFDDTLFPTTGDYVIRVTIKRVIHNYKKGDFSKTPLGETAPVEITKNALPLISFSHTWYFSALIGGTQELPWNGESSPLLVSLQGNDSYVAYLINISTQSGAGISLPDADVQGRVTGNAPGTLRIAYGTNQASTTNTAILVIETSHCGVYTFNLVQSAAGFEVEVMNYREGQVIDWCNIPLGYTNPSYGTAFVSRFPYRYGTVIEEASFYKPMFRLSPFSPYRAQIYVSPTGTDTTIQVADGNYQGFPVNTPGNNVGSVGTPTWWQLGEDATTHRIETKQYPIIANLTPTATGENLQTRFTLNLKWFFMSAFDLTSTIYMLSCNGAAKKAIDFYTNLSESWFVGRYGLQDNSWFTEDASLNPPYFDSVIGHFNNDLEVAEVSPRETQEKRTNFVITLPDRTYYIPVVRPVPRATSFYGEVSSNTSFIATINTNFVNINVWVVANVIVHQGAGDYPRNHYFPLFRLTYVGNDVDSIIENGANLAQMTCQLESNSQRGWTPSFGNFYGDFDYFIDSILPVLRREVLPEYEHLSVVLYYTEDTEMPDGDGHIESNIQGFTDGRLLIAV